MPQLILVWSNQRSLVVQPVQPWSERPGMTWTSLRALSSLLAVSIASLAMPLAAAEASPRDGQHDFDFAHGKWKIRVKRLKAPLKGSKDGVELTGTSTCRPFWGGAGNLDELVVEGPDGRIEAITLRMYSATARQWSLNWSTKKNASFGVPTVGEFRNGRGEFYDQEVWEGRTIFVRYVWSDITRTSAHFEQAFSDDGGKTWEVNWITDQTRVE